MTCCRPESISTAPAPLTHQALNRSFGTSLLLTGSVAGAEAAMLDGIQSMDPEKVSDEALLRGAVIAAIKAGHEGPAGRQEIERASSILPFELRPVLRLPVDLRQPFVLRRLAAFSREDSARLLSLSGRDIDERACAAAAELARNAARS